MLIRISITQTRIDRILLNGQIGHGVQSGLLHQDKIRAWICRTAVVNQLLIEHEDGNEFHA